MRRVTFYLEEDLLEEFDIYVHACAFDRSEYLRAMVEAHLISARRFTPGQFARFGQWKMSRWIGEVLGGEPGTEP